MDNGRKSLLERDVIENKLELRIRTSITQMIEDLNNEFPVSNPDLFRQIQKIGYEYEVGIVHIWIEEELKEYKGLQKKN